MDRSMTVRMSLFILLILIPSIVFSQSEEYILKGVTLEKFTRFIDWPDAVDRADTTKPFVIGILGETIFGMILEELYKDQKIKKKNVVILKISTIQEFDQCHLIFIAKSEKQNIKQIIRNINQKPILTIGDTPGFSEEGVHINFYIENNKIRFEINETAIKHTNFQVSYLLLKHARIIQHWENSK